jgi:hypothetical protein
MHFEFKSLLSSGKVRGKVEAQGKARGRASPIFIPSPTPSPTFSLAPSQKRLELEVNARYPSC